MTDRGAGVAGDDIASVKPSEMSQLIFVQSLHLTKLRGSLLLKSVTSKVVLSVRSVILGFTPLIHH